MLWNRNAVRPAAHRRRMAAGVVLAAVVVATPVAATAASGSALTGASAAMTYAGARVGDVVRADDAPAAEARSTETSPEPARRAETRPEQARPVETRPAETRPEPEPPSPRFDCKAYRTDAGPAVGCAWAEVGEDRAAGYRLWRAVDQEPREVVFETRDLTQHGYRDGDVAPGHTFHYAVQYLAADGSVIVTSQAVRIHFPDERPEVETLRLACEHASGERADATVVACKWSSATSDRVVGYRLIRRDAEGREVVARGGLEFTSHREKVRPGRYAYRVVGVDADGRTLAASEAVAVHVER